MSGPTRDMEDVRAHNRRLASSLQRRVGVVGVANIPGALEAMQEEWLYGYSLADIAVMWGVSRERVRQLFERTPGMHQDSSGAKKRFFDWDLGVFVPVDAREYDREAARRRRAEWERQRKGEIVSAMADLKAELGRAPYVRELARRLFPDTTETALTPALAFCWPNGSNLVRETSYTAVLDAIYAHCGEERPDGRAFSRGRHPALDATAVLRAKSLRAGGATYQEIADALGVSSTTVRAAVLGEGAYADTAELNRSRVSIREEAA